MWGGPAGSLVFVQTYFRFLLSVQASLETPTCTLLYCLHQRMRASASKCLENINMRKKTETMLCAYVPGALARAPPGGPAARPSPVGVAPPRSTYTGDVYVVM
jgi:hypothetical protein